LSGLEATSSSVMREQPRIGGFDRPTRWTAGFAAASPALPLRSASKTAAFGLSRGLLGPLRAVAPRGTHGRGAAAHRERIGEPVLEGVWLRPGQPCLPGTGASVIVTSIPQPLRLYLKDGVQPTQAIEVLTGRILAAKNLPSSVSRGGITPEANAVYLERRQADCIDWAETTEKQLSNVTHNADVLALPYSPAHYEIRQLTPSSPRAIAFIDSEVARQVMALEALRDDMELRLGRACATGGAIAVLDTNVLLHHQLPDSVAWRDVIGEESVRVVIPLRVIEELDEKKYSASDKLRARARERLPKLYAMVGSGGAPKPLKNGHGTIEVFIESGPRTRPSDADTRYSRRPATCGGSPARL
jgi:hypothetical protein